MKIDDFSPLPTSVMATQSTPRALRHLEAQQKMIIEYLQAKEENTMPEDIELPLYDCHKQVRALEIGKIEGCTLHFVDERYAPILMSAEFISRHDLNLPGYLVVYKDGYRSFSPKKAFEDGYTLSATLESTDKHGEYRNKCVDLVESWVQYFNTDKETAGTMVIDEMIALVDSKK